MRYLPAFGLVGAGFLQQVLIAAAAEITIPPIPSLLFSFPAVPRFLLGGPSQIGRPRAGQAVGRILSAPEGTLPTSSATTYRTGLRKVKDRRAGNWEEEEGMSEERVSESPGLNGKLARRQFGPCGKLPEFVQRLSMSLTLPASS